MRKGSARRENTQHRRHRHTAFVPLVGLALPLSLGFSSADVRHRLRLESKISNPVSASIGAVVVDPETRRGGWGDKEPSPTLPNPARPVLHCPEGTHLSHSWLAPCEWAPSPFPQSLQPEGLEIVTPRR